jgi:putative endonuclease
MSGFTQDYRISRLVHFETYSDVRAALAREKQLKRWPRWLKIRVIEARNLGWYDLSVDWLKDGSSSDANGGIQ